MEILFVVVMYFDEILVECFTLFSVGNIPEDEGGNGWLLGGKVQLKGRHHMGGYVINEKYVGERLNMKYTLFGWTIYTWKRMNKE